MMTSPKYTGELLAERRRHESAEEANQLRAQLAAAERERDALAAENARLDAENHALVAVALERCPGLSAELLVRLVQEKSLAN